VVCAAVRTAGGPATPNRGTWPRSGPTAAHQRTARGSSVAPAPPHRRAPRLPPGGARPPASTATLRPRPPGSGCRRPPCTVRRPSGAREADEHARRLPERGAGFGPWTLVEARLVLVWVEILLGEPAAAAALLAEVEEDLRRVPDARAVHRRADQLRTLLHSS